MKKDRLFFPIQTKEVRTILLTLALALTPYTIFGKEKELRWDKLKQSQIDEYISRQEVLAEKKKYDLLLAAKSHLISGNPDKAQHFINLVNATSKATATVKTRLQAVIYFIKDEYKNVLKTLDNDLFNGVTAYPEICLMKVASHMALGNRLNLRSEYASCSSYLQIHSPNELFWQDRAVKLIDADPLILSGTDLINQQSLIQDHDYARQWLKLALLTNNEEVASQLISILPSDVYNSHRTRELIGFIFYRLKNYEKAISFVEDIESANAANIRGNIHFEKKEYELAYGHFKLALKYKEYSRNALERLIPLSWFLEKWNDGLDFISRLVNEDSDIKKKLALNTMLQLRLENYSRALSQITQLKNLYRGQLPPQVANMHGFTSLINNEMTISQKYYNESCKSYDGMSCWIYFATTIWPDLGKTVTRDEPISFSNVIDPEELKAEGQYAGIDEEILVDQGDIEELDGAQVHLQGFAK